ncbi:MAG: cell division protein FtsB [Gammaproteobacteria bacterium]
MKFIAIILLVLLLMLQYRIWLGDGGLPQVLKLDGDIEQVQQKVEQLQERNKALDAEVIDLKTGLQAIEERARSELGMMHKDDVYYQVIERKDDEHGQNPSTPTE